MSFKLMRYKNGIPTPIKLSIWDAFKGAPPPKSRPHECPQCGRLHGSGTKDELTAPAQAAKSIPEAKQDKPTKEAKSHGSQANEHSFTAEEDAKILELKAENTSWAKIAEALGNGRSKGMVSHRYKQIKVEEKPVEDDKKDEKPMEQMSKAERKAFKAQQDRDAGLKRQEAEAKDKSEAATAAAEDRSAQTQAPEHAPVPDPKPSQPAMKDKQKWIAAASKHFDKTGQRITPEQARKMAEEGG